MGLQPTVDLLGAPQTQLSVCSQTPVELMETGSDAGDTEVLLLVSAFAL